MNQKSSDLKQVIIFVGTYISWIIAFCFIVPIVSIINPADGLAAGSELIKNADILRPASSWVSAMFIYFSWTILLSVAYVTRITIDGKQSDSVKTKGLIGGNILWCVICALPILALISNASVILGAEAPNLVLASRIFPVLGIVYAVIVVSCIYTTATPFAWMTASIFTKEGTTTYKVLVVVLVAVAFVGGQFMTFSQIVNLATSISAYVGYILLAAIIITKIIRRPAVPAERETENGQTAIR